MGAAPDTAAYLLQAINSLLPNARVLQVGGGLLSLTDGGAGGNMTVGLLNSAIAHGPLSGLAANDHPQYILSSVLTANGDLLYRASGAPAALAIGSAKQFLQPVGGLPAWTTPDQFSYVLSHVDATVDVVNTASETDIFNFTIPGGTMAVGDVLELSLPGDLTNTSGSNKTYQVRIYVGGTLYYDSTSGGFQTTQRLVTHLVIRLVNQVTASGQVLWGWQQQGSFNSTPATGEGVIGSTAGNVGIYNAVSKNMANNQALRVTITWSGASPSTSWRVFSAQLIHHRGN